MRTANLTGALLDYWVARAEGVQAAELEILDVPRTDRKICVHTPPAIPGWMTKPTRPLPYSTNWALTGPLLEKHFVEVFCNREPRVWSGFITRFKPSISSLQENGETPLIAICRAVVRAAFGDEVEDLP